MRDLGAYQRDFRELPFERTQERFRKKKVMEVMERYQPASVLEIGCGLDPFFNHYRAFRRFTVIEPGAEFVRIAREQSAQMPGVMVVQGSLEDSLDILSRESYDMILMGSLLHEVPDCKGLLDAVQKLCGAATIVHVNVPNALSLHRLLAVEMSLIADPYERSATQQKMQQTHVFDLAMLEALAHECGFDVVDRGSFFIKPFTHAQMAALQKTGFLTEGMLEGLYGLARALPGHGSEIFVDLRSRSGA
jgi:2-polyprenyl-3-methyl-5-hydroxy-6-metoxy-1,4-benzoquinol methylase